MRTFPLALAFLCACSTAPSEEPLATVKVTAARGLHTNENPLALPEGALTQADNVVIDSPGLIETRRGTEGLAALSDASPVTAWADFGGAVLAMRANGKLARLQGGVWTDYAGTYPPPTGARTRFAEEGKALYFTSAAGLWKLDALTGTPVLAGGAKAIDGAAVLTGTSGFLPQDSAVAYRFVWGLKDANNRLVLGAVSGRTVVVNPSTTGGSRDVTLTVPIPTDVTSSHFLQVYRSGLAANASSSPDDECRQVYEAVPTAAEIAARSLAFTDSTPEELRSGPNLYTNPNSGGGILSTKERPPLCKDLVSFKGHLVGACTTGKQRLSLALLTADPAMGGFRAFTEPTPGIPTDILAVDPNATEDATLGRFKVYTAGSAAQNIEDTAKSIVRAINGKPSNAANYIAYYTSGEDEAPGRILIEAVSPALAQFSVYVASGLNNLFSPSLGELKSITAASKTGNVLTLTLGAAHGLSVGSSVYILSALATFPAGFDGGTFTVASIPTTTTLTLVQASSVVGTTVFTVGSFLPLISLAPAGIAKSDPSDAPNGLAISGTQEPDAFPPLNTLYVGGPDAISRVVALRDSVFILKAQGGVYRLVGDSPSTFRVEPFDTTLRLLAPESAVALNNQVYALTNQGVVAFSDAGSPEILSIPIESALLSLQGTAAAQVAAQAFAVAYESDRKYLLWLPASSASSSPAQAYAYNYVTGTWTRRTDAAHSGYISTTDDKLHLALAAGGAVRERKTRTNADYAAPDGTAVQAAVAYGPQTAGEPGEGKQWYEAQVFVQGAAPSALGLVFTSEATGAGPTLTLAGTLATYVTPEQMRCAQLTLALTHAVAGEPLRLRGYALTYRAYGGRGRR